jgi:glycerol kinase
MGNDDSASQKTAEEQAGKQAAYLPHGIGKTTEEQRRGWFVGSIDQGTTSSRFIIFNEAGEPVASRQIEFENLYPESG